MIKAVLFDMDGLVLDTEKLYARFWREAADCLGYEMSYEQALGMRSLNRTAGEQKLQSYFDSTVSYEQVRNQRIMLMNAYIQEHGVEMKAGVIELLDYLDKQGIKKAIATSSPPERTLEYLTMVGLERRFDKIVSGYMVEHGKPDPDIYLYAAKELEVLPEECLVLEDSPAGILAAYRAGCKPVFVPDLDEADEETKKLLYGEVKQLGEVAKKLLAND
jgi:HAD superfamily hydrolase (TIGR01509 family)